MTATAAEKQPEDAPHVFVVDDEPQFRAVMSRALTGEGCVPHGFGSVLEVEVALTMFAPELIILDLSLGDSDAIEMIRSLAVSHFGGAILLVSGHDLATLEQVKKIGEMRGLTMLNVLRKPFRVEDLRHRLADAANAAKSAPANADLESALRHNWLELWYQPKIDLKTMTVCGAEALIRLRHPEKGLVPPGAFLPPPGDQLYEPLTDFVVRRSMADWSSFAAWPNAGHRWSHRRIAINVPVSILQSPGFIANLRRHLPKHPDFPGLIVEITEDEAITEPQLALEIATQLRLYNVHVSIDDFGVGYSSLARLDQLPFAELKLDRSFVDGCSDDQAKRETCRTVVDLAKQFSLTAVAEGVENAADLDQLTGMGFDIAQGYYFAKPMHSWEFTRMMVAGDEVTWTEVPADPARPQVSPAVREKP